VARWFWALVAFNFYALFLLSAFEQNIPYLFDAKLVSEMRAAGNVFEINDWGWKDHYIWRLFASVVITALVAFLAGAIARLKGGVVAVVANIPSILVWGAMLFVITHGNPIEGQTGFTVVSVVAIPLTTGVAYYFGRIGGETQSSEFPDDTVLGIRPYHWMWIVFPIYLYAVGIVFVLAKFIVLQLLTWRDMSIVGAIVSLLGLIPVILWIYPLTFVYRVLAGRGLSEKSAGIKAIANAGVRRSRFGFGDAACELLAFTEAHVVVGDRVYDSGVPAKEPRSNVFTAIRRWRLFRILRNLECRTADVRGRPHRVKSGL